MNKQSKNIMKEESFSKNPPDIRGENYVFVKYSDLMDFIQSVNDASIALSRLAIVSADIKLMSTRPEARDGLLQKLMDMSDIKLSRLLQPKSLELAELGKDMDRKSKSIVSPLIDSQNGQTRKSRKR